MNFEIKNIDISKTPVRVNFANEGRICLVKFVIAGETRFAELQP